MVNTTFTHEQAVDAEAAFDTTKLKGKSVIITGGAHGIGEASVRAFVAAGAFVAFGDVNEKLGSSLASELGDKVAFVQCDVTVWKEQLNLFKTALEKSPSRGIDIVFANAGLGTADDVIRPQIDPDTGDPVEPILSTARVNIIGVMYTVQLALHYLGRQPQGEDRDRCILVTASMSGYSDHLGAIQYSASKFAMRGVMRSLRSFLPQHGARINLLAPWFIRTGIMTKEQAKTIDEKELPWAELGDAVSAIMHIASDKSMNGRAVAVLPRNFPGNQKGYLDLKMDDLEEGEVTTVLKSLKASKNA